MNIAQIKNIEKLIKKYSIGTQTSIFKFTSHSKFCYLHSLINKKWPLNKQTEKCGLICLLFPYSYKTGVLRRVVKLYVLRNLCIDYIWMNGNCWAVLMCPLHSLRNYWLYATTAVVVKSHCLSLAILIRYHSLWNNLRTWIYIWELSTANSQMKWYDSSDYSINAWNF